MVTQKEDPQVIGYRFAASIAIENRCPDCAAICYDSGLIFHRGDEQVDEDDPRTVVGPDRPRRE